MGAKYIRSNQNLWNSTAENQAPPLICIWPLSPSSLAIWPRQRANMSKSLAMALTPNSSLQCKNSPLGVRLPLQHSTIMSWYVLRPFHPTDLHQPHSLELAPCDFILFPNWNSSWKVAIFKFLKQSVVHWKVQVQVVWTEHPKKWNLNKHIR